MLLANAGFHEIATKKEWNFPVGLMLHDPAAQRVIQHNQLNTTDFAEIAQSIANVMVQARKY